MTPALQWVDWVWSAIAGACLTLCVVYGALWLRNRHRRTALCFSILSLSVSALSLFELAMMRSSSGEQFLAWQRIAHIPVFVFGVSIAVLACLYFGIWPKKLLAASIACRVLVLLVAFWAPYGANYAVIHGVDRVPFLGDAVVSVPRGVPSAWNFFIFPSWILNAVVILYCAIETWRHGDALLRRRALTVGSAMAVFTVASPTVSFLVHLGLIQTPYMNAPIFLVLLLTMGGELVRENVQVDELSHRLSLGESEMELAAGSLGFAPWSLDILRDQFRSTEGGSLLFGFDARGPLPWSRIRERIHIDDLEKVEASIRRATDARGTMAVEFRIAGDDGHERRFTAFGRVGSNDAGRAAYVRGVAHEVTADRHAQELFRLVVDATPAALIIADREGRIVLANARTLSTFGYTRDELDACSVDELLPERLRVTHASHRSDYADETQARTMGAGLDLMARRKDGSEFPVEVGLSPIAGPQGPLVLATVTDISDRRQLDLAIAQQKSELAHLSRVGVLGELSASIAHELNQPLAAILANAQAAQRYLARERVDLDEVREIVGDIVEDDKRAGEVIRRLRAMLRKEELTHAPLDLNELVAEVLQFMHSDFVNRGITVETVLARDLPQIAGDRIQLQQVLLNLVLNGCDAMAAMPRPRRLTIRTARVASSEVEVAVSDRGTGIAEGDLERIFEPFVTSKAQGTGLGLAVCRTIVAAHDGRIWARNNDLGGASVMVALPLLPSATHEMPTPKGGVALHV